MNGAEGQKVETRRDKFARLKHDCMAIGIWINSPKDDKMRLEDLKNMNTKELTALYNEHAARQVKRMESRAKLEERTAQLLRDAGKLDQGGEDEVSSPVPATHGKRVTNKPPIEAPATEEGNADMATATATKKKASKKTAAKPAGNGAKAQRGAPLTNKTYKVISEKSKKFNPDGNKLQASSSRGLIYAALQKKEAGLTRTKLEEMFPDVNVKSALDVLIKFGFVEAE
jgi:hypothetical protein